MKNTICVLPVLACLALTSFVSVRTDDSTKSTESLSPSLNQTVNCPKYKNCTDNGCHFTGAVIESKNKAFLSDNEWIITCDSMKVDITFPATKVQYTGNETYTCFKYDNGNNTTFPVLQVTLTKPEDVKDSQVICMFDGNKCVVQNSTPTQIILVAGFPGNCTSWSPATPTPTPDTTTAPPATTMTTGSTSTKSDNSTTTVSVPTGTGSNSTSTPIQVSGATVTTSSPVETTTGKGSSDVARLELAAVLVAASALYIRQYL